jgi:hypothetical protein
VNLAGNEVETTINKLQQTVQRPVLPTSLFSAQAPSSEPSPSYGNAMSSRRRGGLT